MWNEVINGCGVIMVLVILGCFAAGAAGEASDRAERKRIQKLIQNKYGRTY